MSDLAHWPEQNDAFLAAALTWLRLRLERLAWQEPPIVVTPEPVSRPEAAQPAQSSFKDRFLRRGAAETGAAPARPLLALPPASEAVTAAQIEEAARAMATAEEIDPPPALVALARRFGLSRFERDVLLLCAAVELDTRIASLCARAQDDPACPYPNPTCALAFSLFDDPAWDVRSPERPLRRWRLLEINQPGAQSLTTSALRADERIVNYLKGLNYLDDRLAPLLLPLEPPDEADLPVSQAEAVRQIVRRLELTAPGRRLPVFQLLGPDAPSKRLVAWHAAASLGLHIYRLPVELLPAQVADLETFSRLIQRESALAPFALYLDAQETEKSTAEGPPLGRFLAGANGVFFVATQDVRPGLGETSVPLDVAKPTAAEQRQAWRVILGEEAGDLPEHLAGQFSLDLGTLRRIARTALAEANEGDDAGDLRDRLWDAALASTRPRLEGLAQRLDPRATWDDLVLPARELGLLRQIAAQVRLRSRVYEDWGFAAKRNRGLGISVLFAGESGTGKTMAAEVIANELRLSLYRIDLSTVVSKYIGETEKNLRRLFDAAEDGGALLFFDEADALFGKRSEVKDSHDRYANIEINYLLQRIESYRGLAILATNLKDSLDTAFLRRLRFIVDFPVHSESERREIWKRIFPEATETEGLDFNRLARLGLNGGAINNVAMNAAFLAAEAGTPVTMPLVLAATRTELQKLGKPVNESDFRWIPVEVPA